MSKQKMADKDLAKMNAEELRSELIRLRNGIRSHRDKKGDDRCWLNDVVLYQLLPEGKDASFKLPDKDTFLKNCERFWRTRQENPSLTSWTNLTERDISDQVKSIVGQNPTERELLLARFIVLRILRNEFGEFLKKQ